MDIYATVQDLEAGWQSLYELGISEDVAETLLKRASAYVTSLLESRNIEIDKTNEVQMTNLTSVVCSLVRRSLSDLDKSNISSIAQSVGSTNVSISYRQQDGGFYLTEADKLLLGIRGKGKARMHRVAIHNPDGTLVEGW